MKLSENRKVGRPKSLPPNSEIANRLKIAREMKGITKKSFSDSIGVTPMTVYNWESGKSSISQNFIDDICKLLCIDKDWLLCNEKEDILDNVKNIFSLFNNANEIIKYSPLTNKEKAETYLYYYSPVIAGYKYDDIKDKVKYAKYISATMKNAVEIYMNTINGKE